MSHRGEWKKIDKTTAKNGRTDGLNWALWWCPVKTCAFSFSICFLLLLIVHNSLAENILRHTHTHSNIISFHKLCLSGNSFVFGLKWAHKNVYLFTLYIYVEDRTTVPKHILHFFFFSFFLTFRKIIRNVSFSEEFIFHFYFPYICS